MLVAQIQARARASTSWQPSSFRLAHACAGTRTSRKMGKSKMANVKESLACSAMHNGLSGGAHASFPPASQRFPKRKDRRPCASRFQRFEPSYLCVKRPGVIVVHALVRLIEFLRRAGSRLCQDSDTLVRTSTALLAVRRLHRGMTTAMLPSAGCFNARAARDIQRCPCAWSRRRASVEPCLGA